MCKFFLEQGYLIFLEFVVAGETIRVHKLTFPRAMFSSSLKCQTDQKGDVCLKKKPI